MSNIEEAFVKTFEEEYGMENLSSEKILKVYKIELMASYINNYRRLKEVRKTLERPGDF